MKYLIAGRSGAGKDHFAKKLVELSMNRDTESVTRDQKPIVILKSYTTRPKRTETEDSHIFITETEAAAYTDKVAVTHINGYEYFATREQVENTDLYIIDPNGIDELTKNMPETDFQIIYIHAAEDVDRRINAVKRAEDKIKEEEVFSQRNAAEDAQFTEFEDRIFQRMDNEICFPANIKSVMIIENDYTEKCLEHHAVKILMEKLRLQKMCSVVRECMDLGVLIPSVQTDKNGRPKITAYREKDGQMTKEEHTVEQCAMSLLGNNEEFRIIMGDYILLSKNF